MELTPISESLVKEIAECLRGNLNLNKTEWLVEGDTTVYDLLNEVLLQSTGEEV